eukprot:SAG22_NODE_198_length_15480_cov_24.005526_6_plen_201_part_00
MMSPGAKLAAAAAGEAVASAWAGPAEGTPPTSARAALQSASPDTVSPANTATADRDGEGDAALLGSGPFAGGQRQPPQQPQPPPQQQQQRHPAGPQTDLLNEQPAVAAESPAPPADESHDSNGAVDALLGELRDSTAELSRQRQAWERDRRYGRGPGHSTAEHEPISLFELLHNFCSAFCAQDGRAFIAKCIRFGWPPEL